MIQIQLFQSRVQFFFLFVVVLQILMDSDQMEKKWLQFSFPPEIKGEMSCCDKDAGDSETKKRREKEER